MRRRLAERGGDDSGFTLVETLVGMALFLLIGTLTSNAVITGLRSQSSLTERSTAMDNLRTAAQRMSRDVREADPVLVAQDRYLRIQQPQSNGSTRILTYQVVGTDLVQDEALTSAAGTVTTSPRRVVVSQLDVTAPLFAYDKIVDYVPQSSSVDKQTCAITGSSPVSYARDCIGRVTLTVTRTLSKGNPLRLTQVMELRNQ